MSLDGLSTLLQQLIDLATAFQTESGDTPTDGDELLTSAITYLSRPRPPTAATPTVVVLMGADCPSLAQGAAQRFVGEWYPSGCRRVVVTGGIGRSTPDLYTRVCGSAASPPGTHGWPPHGLPLLQDYSSFSVAWRPAAVAAHCGEADLYADVFCDYLARHGIDARLQRAGYDADDGCG